MIYSNSTVSDDILARTATASFIDSSDAKHYEVLSDELKVYFNRTLKEERDHARDRLHFSYYDSTEIPTIIADIFRTPAFRSVAPSSSQVPSEIFHDSGFGSAFSLSALHHPADDAMYHVFLEAKTF